MNANDKPEWEASEEVERRMLEFLLQFDPLREISIASAKMIAREARQLSYEALRKTSLG